MKTRILPILLLFSASVQLAVAAQNRLNLLLIISDDQSWTDYSFMGHPHIQTPHLDKLADQSAVFRRGYVPTALCRPALATLATGLYAHQNFITGNDPADTPANRRYEKETGKSARELLISNIDKHPTIARLLRDAGYLTLQTGKWWEGNYKRGGFTHGMTRGYPEKGGRHGDDGLKIGREGLQVIDDFMDEAIGQQKPFYIWYAPFMPHTPHTPPDRLLQKYTAQGLSLPTAKYYAMCEWFDETCGDLLGMLEEKGLSENTLVVYVTDNGWIQDPQKNGYTIRSKRSPYEGGIRTPIMFRLPGQIAPQERTELCSSIDIVPTMLAAARVDLPGNLPGLNLLPRLKDGKPILRKTIFGESFAHDVADIRDPEASLLFRWVIQDNMKLLLTYDGRTGKMKFPPENGDPQLFNLIEDPFEKNNLAAGQKGTVNRLRKRLNDWYVVDERVEGAVSSPTKNAKVIRE